jgi:HisJ family histidinol phosphate phosphatase
LDETLRYDNHVHGGRGYSGHSQDYTLAELADAARAAGITISLREHAPFPPEVLEADPDALKRGEPGTAPIGLSVGRGGNLDEFLADVAATGLSLGFEVDVLDAGQWLGASERLVQLLHRRSEAHGLVIDCLNLSHHHPWDMSYGGLGNALGAAGGPAGFLRSYFAGIRAYAATGLFGAASHLEALRKFDRMAPGGPPFAGHMDLYREEILATLEALRRHGVALEYNTSGSLRWGRPYLSPETLRAAAGMGLRIVIGSDAHRPDHLGFEFGRWAGELAEAGVREVWRFERGRVVRMGLGPEGERSTIDAR